LKQLLMLLVVAVLLLLLLAPSVVVVLVPSRQVASPCWTLACTGHAYWSAAAAVPAASQLPAALRPHPAQPSGA
jgi:hypothetical protein